jgi:hypothetical protein
MSKIDDIRFKRIEDIRERTMHDPVTIRLQDIARMRSDIKHLLFELDRITAERDAAYMCLRNLFTSMRR